MCCIEDKDQFYASWGVTPITPAGEPLVSKGLWMDNPASVISIQDMAEHDRLNKQLLADPAYVAELDKLCTRYPDIIRSDLEWHVGAQFRKDGELTSITSVEDVYSSYRKQHPMTQHAMEVSLQNQKKIEERMLQELRENARREYAQLYSKYVEQCRGRKRRHADARDDYAACVGSARASFNASIKAAEEQLKAELTRAQTVRDNILNEPAPVPPPKPF
jgi:hypothetical protein